MPTPCSLDRASSSSERHNLRAPGPAGACAGVLSNPSRAATAAAHITQASASAPALPATKAQYSVFGSGGEPHACFSTGAAAQLEDIHRFLFEDDDEESPDAVPLLETFDRSAPTATSMRANASAPCNSLPAWSTQPGARRLRALSPPCAAQTHDSRKHPKVVGMRRGESLCIERGTEVRKQLSPLLPRGRSRAVSSTAALAPHAGWHKDPMGTDADLWLASSASPSAALFRGRSESLPPEFGSGLSNSVFDQQPDSVGQANTAADSSRNGSVLAAQYHSAQSVPALGDVVPPTGGFTTAAPDSNGFAFSARSLDALANPDPRSIEAVTARPCDSMPADSSHRCRQGKHARACRSDETTSRATRDARRINRRGAAVMHELELRDKTREHDVSSRDAALPTPPVDALLLTDDALIPLSTDLYWDSLRISADVNLTFDEDDRLNLDASGMSRNEGMAGTAHAHQLQISGHGHRPAADTVSRVQSMHHATAAMQTQSLQPAQRPVRPWRERQRADSSPQGAQQRLGGVVCHAVHTWVWQEYHKLGFARRLGEDGFEVRAVTMLGLQP